MRIIYRYLLEYIDREFDEVKLLKESPWCTTKHLLHRTTRQHFIFRQFNGSGEVYRKLMTLNCPNLPSVMEVAEEGGQTAVLEEYIQGDTLYFLLQGGTLSSREAHAVLRDLCRGLYVLHKLGAVHRDIKPENVILRENTAVLIDFNASRMVKTEQRTDTRVLGTTGFAAPEQYGLSQTDQRADIYALGVLLNVMLTGKYPSTEMAKGKDGRIVRRCTMTNPDQRYQSVIGLLEAMS